MEKANQRVMLTKRLLKESLIAMLENESIYKLSIRELCQNAGINRTTFYKHYGNQFELLEEIEADMLKDIEGMLIEFEGEQLQPFKSVCEYLRRNLTLSRLLINNNVDPEFPRKLFGLPYIQQELPKVIVARYGEDRLDYVTCFLTYGAYNMIGRWINGDAQEPPETMALLLFDVINRLLLTES